MNIINKTWKICVCADGFVSLTSNMKQRRLGAALPVHSTDDPDVAIAIINETCVLRQCIHGGKTGTTLEPSVLWWPHGADEVTLLDAMGRFALACRVAEEKMT